MDKYGFPLISKETSRVIHEIKRNPNSVTAQIVFGLKEAKYKPFFSKRWRYLLKEPYMVSDKCCTWLKKNPFKEYEKTNDVSPILGTMAEESKMRTTAFLKQGSCNVFNLNVRKNKSMPLSIWTEKDVWGCIEKYNIPIAEIYHKGAERTGCMFCGYGCQFKDDNRMQLVYDLYPKWYDRFMSYTNNGVTYREALRKMLAVNGLFLPDERPDNQNIIL